MKKIAIIFLTIVIFTTLTACQATPTNSIVTEKNNQSLINQAKSSGGIKNITDLNIPEKLEGTLKNPLGNMTLTKSAQINIPNVDFLPIYAVKKLDINQEFVDNFMGALSDNSPLFSLPDAENNIPSKEITTTLNIDSSGRPYLNGTIKYNGTNYIVDIGCHDNKNSASFASGFKVNADKIEDTSYPIKLSEQDIQKYSNIIKNMGFSDMSLSKIYPLYSDNGDSYQLIFMREYSKAPSLYVRSMLGSDRGSIGENNDSNYSFSQSFGDEFISVIIDDYSLQSFKLENPYTSPELIVEKSNLMNFEEICQIFDKMVMIVHSIDVYGEDFERNITVKEVNLGMQKIKTDNSNEGLVVPAWDFVGDIDNCQNMSGSKNQSLLTINAIDGTIVDTFVGN